MDPRARSKDMGSGNWKELLREADALYMKSQYEEALVKYYRAKRVRPNSDEIRLGIIRCEESLNKYLKKKKSAVPNKDISKSEDPNEDPDRTMSFSEWASSLVSSYNATHSGYPTVEMKNDAKHLRKLTDTKQYLHTLGKEFDHKKKKENKVKHLISSEIEYLQHHFNFWKHQIPPDAACQLLPAREAEQKPMKRELTNLESSVITEVLVVLKAFQAKDHRKVIEFGKPCIKLVESSTYLEMENKDEISSNLHSAIGSSYFETQHHEDALNWYKTDLEIAKTRNLPSSVSRALGNIGRVYAKMGKYAEAVKIWEEKVPMCRTDAERAWLHHELGYCYIAQNIAEKALFCAEQSYDAATKIDTTAWLQNSMILAGQALVMLGKPQDALFQFQKALDILEREDKADEEAIDTLTKAMSSIKEVLQHPQTAPSPDITETVSDTAYTPPVRNLTPDGEDQSNSMTQTQESEKTSPCNGSVQERNRTVSATNSNRSKAISGLGSTASVKTTLTEQGNGIEQDVEKKEGVNDSEQLDDLTLSQTLMSPPKKSENIAESVNDLTDNDKELLQSQDTEMVVSSSKLSLTKSNANES